ncbi:MAG: site-specific DNA-methyltransferase [Fimbriimonadia bacterium]|nr:site-specific DNA-methyltransferase [Fimbriimonadia bacterium]
MKTNVLYCGDAAEIMARLPAESIDLIIADPPYNLGKKYGNNRDLRTWEEYEAFTRNWLSEAKRILKPTGSLYVFMGFRFIARLYTLLEDEFGLFFNGWITWHYTQGMGRKNGFSPRHEDILYFTKSENFIFNLDAVRVPQKYYRERNNMIGANPGDVWQFSHVHYCSAERTLHPTQKPEALMERMILASSNPAGVVLDPFVGSGTTCKVARVLNRQWMGIDLNPDYIQMSQERIETATPELDSYDPRMMRTPRDLPNPPKDLDDLERDRERLESLSKEQGILFNG